MVQTMPVIDDRNLSMNDKGSPPMVLKENRLLAFSFETVGTFKKKRRLHRENFEHIVME